jgi:hypothetical protein
MAGRPGADRSRQAETYSLGRLRSLRPVGVATITPPSVKATPKPEVSNRPSGCNESALTQVKAHAVRWANALQIVNSKHDK